ncbi:MAG: hypothetical protein V1754_03860, partial [Pseudomonadota bacterium]
MYRSSLFALVMIVSIGCNEDFSEGNKDAGTTAKCNPGENRCNGNVQQSCKDGTFYDVQTCQSPQICVVSLGFCADCDPNFGVCKGDDLFECTSSGTVGNKLKTCAKDKCVDGACIDPCASAEASRSYVGCSYWPTVTSNSQVPKDFSFAVVIANHHAEQVQVSVSSLTNPSVAQETILPQSVGTITLPWVDELKQAYGEAKSLLVEGGAYHLQASLPVTVYQFNPLHYVVNFECKEDFDSDPFDGKCFSYTNDASLLLPESTLTQRYMVVSRPSLYFTIEGSAAAAPGFFAVVATQPGDTKVDVTFTANT